MRGAIKFAVLAALLFCAVHATHAETQSHEADTEVSTEQQNPLLSINNLIATAEKEAAELESASTEEEKLAAKSHQQASQAEHEAMKQHQHSFLEQETEQEAEVDSESEAESETETESETESESESEVDAEAETEVESETESETEEPADDSMLLESSESASPASETITAGRIHRSTHRHHRPQWKSPKATHHAKHSKKHHSRRHGRRHHRRHAYSDLDELDEMLEHDDDYFDDWSDIDDYDWEGESRAYRQKAHADWKDKELERLVERGHGRKVIGQNGQEYYLPRTYKTNIQHIIDDHRQSVRIAKANQLNATNPVAAAALNVSETKIRPVIEVRPLPKGQSYNIPVLGLAPGQNPPNVPIQVMPPGVAAVFPAQGAAPVATPSAVANPLQALASLLGVGSSTPVASPVAVPSPLAAAAATAKPGSGISKLEALKKLIVEIKNHNGTARVGLLKKAVAAAQAITVKPDVATDKEIDQDIKKDKEFVGDEAGRVEKLQRRLARLSDKMQEEGPADPEKKAQRTVRYLALYEKLKKQIATLLESYALRTGDKVIAEDYLNQPSLVEALGNTAVDKIIDEYSRPVRERVDNDASSYPELIPGDYAARLLRQQEIFREQQHEYYRDQHSGTKTVLSLKQDGTVVNGKAAGAARPVLTVGPGGDPQADVRVHLINGPNMFSQLNRPTTDLDVQTTASHPLANLVSRVSKIPPPGAKIGLDQDIQDGLKQKQEIERTAGQTQQTSFLQVEEQYEPIMTKKLGESGKLKVPYILKNQQ